MSPTVPECSSGEEDQVDVLVQSEGENHHADEGQAVHSQSGHPARQQGNRSVTVHQPTTQSRIRQPGTNGVRVSLVRLCAVQPQATEDGADHSGNNQG